MATDTPIACSLNAPELEQRLAEIAAVGAAGLVSHDREADRHLLRFRASATARGQLEAIVAAEAECCSFLDLSLHEEGEELVLSIAAPGDARTLAHGLAEAFGKPR